MKHLSQSTQLTIRTADDLARLLDRTQHYRAIRLGAPISGCAKRFSRRQPC